MATRDHGAAYVLLRRFRSRNTPFDLLLSELDAIPGLISHGKVHVVAERIADSGWNASAGPITTLAADYAVTNGQLVLPLPSFGTFDGYFVRLTPFVPLPGDVDFNGSVDAADYVVWRKNGGTSQEFAAWAAGFGARASTVPAASSTRGAAAPEPYGVLLLMMGALALVGRRC